MPRIKTYDREEVLAKAMWVFWEKGFLGTSMQDLVEGMGINRFSIYDSFESKDQLFVLCLRKYRDQILSSQLAILTSSKQGLESISVYFQSLVNLYKSGKVPPKCFMAATISELAGRSPDLDPLVQDYLEDLEDGFEAALSRAEDLGEVKGISPSDQAKLLVSLSLGLTLLAGPSGRDYLESLVAQIPGLLLNN